MSASRKRRLHPAAFLALLVLVVFAADRLGSATLSRIVLLSGSRVPAAFAGRAGDDVLILGNSVADAMTTPKMLERASGLSAYSLAEHGLDAQTQYALVKTYLAKNRAPRFAILEMRAASDRAIFASDFTMLYRQCPDLVTLAEKQSPPLIPWRHIFTLTNFNSRYFINVVAHLDGRLTQDESAQNGRINEAMKQRFLTRRPKIELGRDALAAFRDTISLLQRHGATVIVVAAPMHPVTREIDDGTQHYVAALRHDLPPGTRFVDAMTELKDDRYFDDPIHLNKVGRQAFTPRLAAVLKSGADGNGP